MPKPFKYLRETKGIDAPPYSSGQTFKQAEKVKKKEGKQEELRI